MASDFRFNKLSLGFLLAVAFLVMVFIVHSARRGSYVEETVKISELLAVSIQLAEAGGKRVVEVRQMEDSEIGQLSKGQTKEGKNEYVTMGDQRSHEIIVSGLKATWPNLLYRSEETDRRLDPFKEHVSLVDNEVMRVARRDEAVPLSEVTVWIDPLDATQEYTEGHEDPKLLQFVTVMVCIAVEGKPVAGVIHQPYVEDPKTGKAGVTKWGWVGHGMSRSLHREISRESKDAAEVQVIASRSHPGDVFDIAEKAFHGYKRVEKVIAAGAGYKALQVGLRHCTAPKCKV